MSEDTKPDRVVKESTIREAVNAVAEGLAANARMVGALPDSRAIEAYAQDVVAHQVKAHEAAFANGEPEKPKRKAQIEEVRRTLDDTFGQVEHFVRPLGEARADWTQPGGSAVVAADAGLTAAMERHKKAPPTREDMLLAERVQMLIRQYPDWREKIYLAHRTGANQEFIRQLATGQRPNYKEIESKATDAVIEVANDSNRLFGDWRHPRQVEPKIIMM